jgi:hypothetical protein
LQNIFLDEDEEMDKCVSFIETYDEDNIAYHLPESVNPDQILKTVQPKFSETAEQKFCFLLNQRNTVLQSHLSNF